MSSEYSNFHEQRGEADVLPLKPTQELGLKRIKALRFGITIAFMMYTKKLLINGGETATAAKNLHVTPKLFMISRQIRHFGIIETN